MLSFTWEWTNQPWARLLFRSLQSSLPSPHPQSPTYRMSWSDEITSKASFSFMMLWPSKPEMSLAGLTDLGPGFWQCPLNVRDYISLVIILMICLSYSFQMEMWSISSPQDNHVLINLEEGSGGGGWGVGISNSTCLPSLESMRDVNLVFTPWFIHSTNTSVAHVVHQAQSCIPRAHGCRDMPTWSSPVKDGQWQWVTAIVQGDLCFAEGSIRSFMNPDGATHPGWAPRHPLENAP